MDRLGRYNQGLRRVSQEGFKDRVRQSCQRVGSFKFRLSPNGSVKLMDLKSYLEDFDIEIHAGKEPNEYVVMMEPVRC